MAATILPLPDGSFSLEFDEADIDAVESYIAAHFAPVEQTVYPTLVTYHFGYCSFVFQNEWGDPCLIANSEKGHAILVQILENLNG